jgi:hypothetical protein
VDEATLARIEHGSSAATGKRIAAQMPQKIWF